MTDTTTTAIGEVVDHEPEKVYPTTLMTPRQLVTAVAGLALERKRLGLKTSRSSVGEWRKDLGFRHGPFTMPHAIALAHYGDQLGLKVPKSKAKANTKEFIKTQAEQENDDGK